MNSKEGRYASEQRVTIAETPNLRVRMLALAQGQAVPWHYHSQITDTFFCMDGPMAIQTRNPDNVHILQPGGTFAVAPGIAHYVSGVEQQPCRFMLVQGVGEYDYIAIENQP